MFDDKLGAVLVVALILFMVVTGGALVYACLHPTPEIQIQTTK